MATPGKHVFLGIIFAWLNSRGLFYMGNSDNTYQETRCSQHCSKRSHIPTSTRTYRLQMKSISLSGTADAMSKTGQGYLGKLNNLPIHKGFCLRYFPLFSVTAPWVGRFLGRSAPPPKKRNYAQLPPPPPPPQYCSHHSIILSNYIGKNPLAATRAVHKK